MLTALHLRDFKSHRATDIALSRFTMLVGENASGKTSVLEALYILGQLDPDPVQLLRDDYAPFDLMRRGDHARMRIGAESRDAKGGAALAELRFEIEGEVWELSASASTLGPVLIARGSKVGGSSAKGWEAITDIVGRSGMYAFRADRVASAAYSDQRITTVGFDGTNTAAALAELKLGNDEAFDRIEEQLRGLVPAVRRIRLQPAFIPSQNNGSVKGWQVYFDFRGGITGVPANHASHGTLIVLALLTVLHGPYRPGVVLLDDLDHALHPRAQIELVRLLRRLLESDPKFQIVATTHSPYIVDEIDVSDVRVFASRKDGTAAVKSLAEHPDAAKTAGVLRAGQLWSLDPEVSWVVEG